MSDRGALEAWLVDNGITTVRLLGTNHDGLILGKYLAPRKFLSSLDAGSVMADTAFGVDSFGRGRGRVGLGRLARRGVRHQARP